MQRFGNDAIRLALLQAIELESLTLSQLAQLMDTLPTAGTATERQIQVALQRDSLAFGHWASNDFDELGQPQVAAELLWTITDAGAADLERLRGLLVGPLPGVSLGIAQRP